MEAYHPGEFVHLHKSIEDLLVKVFCFLPGIVGDGD